jgi:hypothetical protein
MVGCDAFRRHGGAATTLLKGIIRHLPEFDGPRRAGRRSAALADAFTVAIGRYNAPIRSFEASDPRIARLDLD